MTLPESNPYESPANAEAVKVAEDLRRPGVGTFLLGLWLLEGGIKTSVVFVVMTRGANPLRFIASEYHASNRLLFIMVAWFMIVETIGPWIGVYYLTGRRARTIPFDKAAWKILKLACAVSVIATILLMIYCEIAIRVS